MGNLRFSLGHVQYDGESAVAFPVAAQVGLGVGTSLLALGVIIIVLMYRWVQPDVAALGQVVGCGRTRKEQTRAGLSKHFL
jgi:hypothetical protein